ncbi:MAG: ketoacyl-ACP synthase III [Gemmatimonadota bacterium]|nr:ketoacyl-ACP synthase III [Gemmatimonadota bacterium]
MSAERHATITGTGHAVPSRLVTNDELAAALGEDIHPFVEGTLGIHQRFWCADGESTATLATEAGRCALAAAGKSPLDVDLLIIATDTPEFISPPTASVVHRDLGTARAGTFDLNAGCAGFVTALDTAWKFIRADERYRCVLVIGAYAMSKFLDLRDKKTVTIFADGAGAAVVELADRPGVLASELFADGSLCEGMGVFAGGTREPITPAVLERGHHNRLRFVQKYPASVNEEGWPRIVRSVLARIGKSEADVDHWLWTQVNRSTIVMVMERLGQPLSKAHTIMGQWGYTGSACLPMALDDAQSKGLLKDGDLIVFTGSGAGLAMGCVAMTWRTTR